MKLMNELDDIYSNQSLVPGQDGKYVCSVCSKRYKKLETLKTHNDKRTCHTAVDLFKDTPTEYLMLNVFTVLSFREKEKSQVTLGSFRRSKHYTQVADFFVFCRKNNIQSWENYVEYCAGYYNGHITGFLSYLNKETTLTNYYQWSRANINDEKSKRFMEENIDKLRESYGFLIRSLEKGNLSLEDAISGLGSSYFVNTTAVEKKMICDLYA